MGKIFFTRRLLIAVVLSAVSLAGAPAPVRAQVGPLPGQTFPSADDYFSPKLADPTELSYGGRYILEVGGDRFGEVNIGDYVGLLRWHVGGAGVQLNLGGGANARFDLTMPQNQMEVVDFTAAAPIDIHWLKAHTIRTGLWHTSSHLGDDFIRTNHLVKTEKRSMDSLKAIYSYQTDPKLRAYAGGSYAVNTVDIIGRGGLQAGLELMSPYYTHNRAQAFLAQDLQSWERVSWNPSYTIRGGARFSDVKRIAAAEVFLEYFTGRRLVLQLFNERESLWAIGLKFEIGNPTRE